MTVFLWIMVSFEILSRFASERGRFLFFRFIIIPSESSSVLAETWADPLPLPSTGRIQTGQTGKLFLTNILCPTAPFWSNDTTFQHHFLSCDRIWCCVFSVKGGGEIIQICPKKIVTPIKNFLLLLLPFGSGG